MQEAKEFFPFFTRNTQKTNYFCDFSQYSRQYFMPGKLSTLRLAE